MESVCFGCLELEARVGDRGLPRLRTRQRPLLLRGSTIQGHGFREDSDPSFSCWVVQICVSQHSYPTADLGDAADGKECRAPQIGLLSTNFEARSFREVFSS